MLPQKSETHKNHEWFSGHYSQVTGTAESLPLFKKVTITWLKIMT
jgi:hypothetical protein